MPSKQKKAASTAAPSQKPSNTATHSSAATSSNIPPSQPERTMTDSKVLSGTEGDQSTTALGQAPVNRKKQKRREKEAAKRAAEQHAEEDTRHRNGHIPANQSLQARNRPKPSAFKEETDDLDHYHGHYHETDSLSDPDDELEESMGQPKRKKKSKGKSINHAQTKRVGNPSLSAAALHSANQSLRKHEIWNTSTQAERENIKEFWLHLAEDDRRSLVKVEKEAVLRKMKEQQKHSCSCTVCGRKRTAIEEELEVLYDAYYDELEQFAHRSHALSNGATIMSDPRAYGQLRNHNQPMAGQYPLEGGHDPISEEEVDDEEYEGEDESYSGGEMDMPHGPPADFFTFGNSLTVKDGILTVADDLLKNDGQHFIDMMESLAEKRMQREQATHAPPGSLYTDPLQGHPQPPLTEEDDYDDELDDEDYDSADEELDEDEMDALTEDQRMEEGRRMFQIFAARMFEQRVLTAYREKVANDRQQKLLEELEEEDRNETQLAAKKAREAAKKKEKKQKQKQVKDEEKAKKEAEKAAHEAAIREAEAKKLEEQRQRKEEQRKKREAEKKAADEERHRKEAEKQKRLQEERDRQMEAERKQREAKDREKKKREDARRKEREDKESKEKEAREARERQLQDEQDRKAAEQAGRDKEAAAGKATRQDDQSRRAARRPVVAVPKVVSHSNHVVQSPQFTVAIPAVPVKVPTPGRPRQPSRQGPQSHGSSPQSAHAATADTALSSTPSSSSFTMSSNQASTANMQKPAGAGAGAGLGPVGGHGPALQHPQPSVPISPLGQNRSNQPPPGYHPLGQPTESGFGLMSGMHSQLPPMSQMPMPPMSHMPQGGGPVGPAYPLPPGGFRGFGQPNGPSFPPGITNPRHGFPHGLGNPFQPSGASGVAPALPLSQGERKVSGGQLGPLGSMPPPSHERLGEIGGELNPISRHKPIGPSSNSTPERKENHKSDADVEPVTRQLGSKALLEDSDEPLLSNLTPHLPPPGAPGSGRAPGSKFGDPRFDAFNSKNWQTFSSNAGYAGQANWGGPGQAPNPQVDGWPTPIQPNTHAHTHTQGFGFAPAPGPAGYNHSSRAHLSRPVALRLMLIDAYRASTSGGPELGKPAARDDWVPATHLLNVVQGMKTPTDPEISMREMLDICDTEGSASNGGGGFQQRNHQFQHFEGPLLRFVPGADGGPAQKAGVIAGSPILGIGSPPLANFGGIGQPVTGQR